MKQRTTPRGGMAALSLAMLLASLGTSIANVALPALSLRFSVSFQQVQWVVLAYLLASTALIVGAGRLGDLMGRRRLLLGGLLLFAAASLAAGLAAFPLLVATRAAQGLGAAVMMALSMAFVADILPQERIGRAMGWLGTMSAVGTALGPSLGGAMIAAWGWRSIFFLLAALAAAAWALACHSLPEDEGSRPRGKAGFDQAGTALLALATASYALAMTTGRGHFGAQNAAWLAAALAGGAAFVWRQRRAASPLLRLDMLRDPGLSGGMAMSGLVAAVMMATLVVGPFYLARGLGLNMAEVGLVMSAGPALSALSGLPAGMAVDRFGARGMALAGLLAMLGGAVALSLTPAGWGVPGYLAALLMLTAGYAQFQAANNTQVMASSGANGRGLVSGLLNLARNLGLLTGAGAMGTVFAAAAGTDKLATAAPEAIARGMHAAFAVSAGLIALAVLIALGSILPALSAAVGREARRDAR
ncbi:MFS transporter [Chromobacterium sp. IIBBL 290-4]|uniref:MFS transporter n=1 Tax=Chromobacterium sp. IIBBL 290-4 TaxID=2953890 RepID=UPI0020B8E144|nr:MFS transporter [Chromobacterium sp. IIBBL 290-4]UTH74677.1 MFS transporter [Chromobacterium sp. IIBBL 290-4]